MSDMDLDKVPMAAVFPFSASALNWSNCYEWADALEKRFPGQGAADLGSAIAANGMPEELKGVEITQLVCVVHSGNEEGDWTWALVVNGTSYDYDVWVAKGGCDYTGWDCQSDLRWLKAVV